VTAPELSRPSSEAGPAWAHECGAAALSSGPPSAEGSDTPATSLAEPLSRYCWAYDERRREMLADCFTADGVWEGIVAGGQTVGPFRGRERIVEWLAGFWPHQRDQRRHVLNNFLVDSRSGSEAEIYAYLQLYSARDGKVKLETTGFYRAELLADEGSWRIRRLFAGFDAPFWPGRAENLSERARRRHGLLDGD
jgi:SnoaL-like domain